MYFRFRLRLDKAIRQMHKAKAMNKVLTPILAIAAVGGALFSVSLWNARAASEAAAMENSRRISALEKSLREALDAANAAKDDLSVQKLNAERLTKERDSALKNATVSSETKPAGEVAPAGDAKPQFDMRNMIGNLAKTMDDPEQRKAMKSMNERMVSGAYEKLFKQIGLNEDDTKLVSELIGERNFTAMDRGRKLLTGQTDEAAIAEVRKDIASTKTDYDTKLRAVLGDEKFRELNDYERTVADRRSIEAFVRDFERKGHPLDASQKEKLTAIVVEERLKISSTANQIPDLAGGPGMDVLLSETEAKAKREDDEALQKRIASRSTEAGLSPDQVVTLQAAQKRQQEMKVLQTVMTRAFLMPKADKP